MSITNSFGQLTIGNKRALLYGGVCFVILFFITSASLTLLYLRQEAQKQVQLSSENLASSLVQTFDGMIDTIDIALQSVVDEVSRQQAADAIDADNINKLLLRQAKRVPHLAFIRITDEKGNIVYGVENRDKPTNLNDRTFFQLLVNDPQAQLIVSQPVFAKVAQKWVWPFARRINRGDGTFAGIVYASVYAEEIEDIFRKIHIGEGSSIALRDQNLTLIARTTFDRNNTIPIGSTSISNPFKNTLKLNPNRGTYTSDATSSDAITRIYSYQRSDKYNYIANIGLATDVALKAWEKHVGVVSLILVVFAITLLYLTRKIDLAWRQYDDAILTLKDSAEQLSHKHQLLKDSDKKHRSILERLHTAIVVHAPDTSIIFSNSRASELLGLSEDQLIGKVAIDPNWCFVDESGKRMHPDQYPVQRALTTKKSFSEMVLGIRHPDTHEILWAQVSAFLEHDEQHQLHQIIVNFNDITERKEAEMRWQFALEGAGDGVWDINLITKKGQFSKTYLSMLGYPEHSFEENYNELFSLIHPEDRSHLLAEIENYRNGQSSQFSAEYRMRCADGKYKWIFGRGMVVSVNEAGQSLRMVGTHTDISAMKNAEEKIWTEANYDSLTKLPNRRLFYDRVEENIKKAQREHETVALLFIDLDRFKEVNDTLGHHVGDQLLIQAATRIKSSVRVYDTVARIGGDEFTVILTDVHDTVDVGKLAEKIIAQLSQPFTISGVESYVSASIGIALYPNDAQSVIELTQQADQAMYSAKDNGRQCFRFFTKTMQEDATHRMRLANDLRHALRQNQFLVYYQPIIDLSNGQTYKAEALIRWQHPELGFISPASFIPIAEDTGTIHQIGNWVFSQAIEQVKICQSLSKRKFQISVNKSPVQFLVERGDQQQWLDQILDSGIDGDNIVIEITEGILINNDIRVTQSLLQYRDAKIQVAIDDFGTGYSSLSYLKKFDVDYLKIDQSFTQNLSLHSSEYALCEAIIVMAHKLGIQVIAEGVETEEQHQLLKKMGCDFAQGYLFSRPVPAAQLIEFITATSAIDAH
ncbi:EAL domain-containing protein [Undibacterium sp. Ji22W]|uniref:bifunctional diguanylate cyclase/phosphodiesterase n=1 Tax=Undibacterium sp. Ji22W TaxID=3413038 RepID=UPI003BF15D7D